MSLINCSECGRQISDQAESCPNCGFPMSYLNNMDDSIHESIKNDKEKLHPSIKENKTFQTISEISLEKFNALKKHKKLIVIIGFITLALIISVSYYNNIASKAINKTQETLIGKTFSGTYSSTKDISDENIVVHFLNEQECTVTIRQKDKDFESISFYHGTTNYHLSYKNFHVILDWKDNKDVPYIPTEPFKVINDSNGISLETDDWKNSTEITLS